MSERTPRQAYAALRNLAREEGRGTQQMFELYVHERFLARLATSPFAERFVLKGGMLLAVLDVRRATRDADLLARGIASDANEIRSVVREIASIPMGDGVAFDTSDIVVAPIREAADYPGMRVKLPVGLADARLKLTLDLSFGDPIAARRIDYPTLLDDVGFGLLGYPLESVIAEKAVTMLTLGDANTRDRDYADVYLLSRIHTIDATTLLEALQTVAAHRGVEWRPLGQRLETLRDTRQRSWAAFRDRVGLSGLPELFADVVDGVVAFLDGLHSQNGGRWNAAEERWE